MPPRGRRASGACWRERLANGTSAGADWVSDGELMAGENARGSSPQSKSGPSLETAYDEHVWRVYGFFAYRLDSRADAEDLTQATFERARAAPSLATTRGRPAWRRG